MISLLDIYEVVKNTKRPLHECEQYFKSGMLMYVGVKQWRTQKVDSNIYQPIVQNSNAVSIEMDLLQVGSEPVGMHCPYCQEEVMTSARYRNTRITHIVASVLAIFFWWMCCCILPYMVKKWKNVEHYCPNCNNFLGVYSRTSVI